MFKFLDLLSYDGKRGTVLQLEDTGDHFKISVVYINPVFRPRILPESVYDECPDDADIPLAEVV